MTYRCMNGHERDFNPPWGLEADSQICWECGYTMMPLLEGENICRCMNGNATAESTKSTS